MIIEFEIMCQSCGKKNLLINNVTEGYIDTLFCTNCSKELVTFRCYYGYVYYLSNKAMPGYIKIGCTSRDVISRVKELNSATGVPEPFIINAFFPSTNHHEDEQAIHESLSRYRVENKEFFLIDIDEALEKTKKIIKNVNICFLDRKKNICTEISNFPKCYGERDFNKDIPGKCRSCMHERACYEHEVNEWELREEQSSIGGSNNFPDCFGNAPKLYRDIPENKSRCQECKVRWTCYNS